MTKRLAPIIETIRNRRSIRRFNSKSISRSVIEKMVDAARWAPCPNNIQPWKFYLVKRNSAITSRVIDYLQRKSRSKGVAISIFLNDAIRVVKSCDAILYVFNTEPVKNRYKKMVSMHYQKKASLFEHQAIAAAIENLILAGETFGIGSVWLGSPVMVNKGIEQIFDTQFKLDAMIALGYYDKKPRQTPRLPVSEILTFK